MLFHRNISLPLAALLGCLLLVTSCRKNANTDVTKEERATLSETIKEYDNLGKKCRDDSQFEKAIGYHKKKVILYNLKGFWDHLIHTLDDLQQRGFVRGQWKDYIQEARSLEELEALL